MENKTILHLHLYLYNENLKKIARDNIKKMKSYGFKVLVTSGLPLPEDFYEFCDYIFIDHDNLQFKRKYKSLKPVNFFMNTGSVSMNFGRNYQQRHALAVIHSIVKGCHLAKLLGYENIIKLVYDCKLGVESANKIKEIVSEIENDNFEMIFYENLRSDIDGDNSDISGQILYYKVDPFLEIFGKLINENEYVRLSEKIGFEGVILDLETLLYRYLKNSTKNIKYLDESLFFSDYNDSKFNQVLSTKSETDESGFLYDVSYLVESGNTVNDRVALCVYNQHYPLLNSVEFKIYDYNDNQIDSRFMETKDAGYWVFDIYYIDNVKKIETFHTNSGVIKQYEITHNDGVINIKVDGMDTSSNLKLN